LQIGDRLLVVADNCTDDTADVARAKGAEVIGRDDSARRGKGYALDFGLRHLKLDPPDIVIMVDADCRLGENAIGELSNTCAATHRPVQGLYLMTPPVDAQFNHDVAQFAWRVKNSLRPSGLAALSLPCQLMGTGMAFPWDVICSVDLASGSIVEDLKLGLELAANGYAPVFCSSALVKSEFASSRAAAKAQRQRWEGGHLDLIAGLGPRLLRKALVRRDLRLLALTLDLAVPPLSLLAILVMSSLAAAVLFRMLGYSSASLPLSSLTFIGFMLATWLAWLKCGREVLPARALLLIVPYVLRKIELYSTRPFKRRGARWVRTDRVKSE
jgi:cellulose synthase/poly-beta-1,6-N-acetylglucosamine synthase-like glycosyltransferase